MADPVVHEYETRSSPRRGVDLVWGGGGNAVITLSVSVIKNRTETVPLLITYYLITRGKKKA